MRRLVRAAKAGAWPSGEAADRLTLTFNDRHRRRIRLSTDGGSPVLLDLPQSSTLADGDGLAFEDGGWLAVRTAEEDVLDVDAENPRHLARLAWHLGNRHLPTEMLADGRLRIAYDHVIEAMLEGLGARCTRRQAPFQPEAGAYAIEHRHD
jgi:urease accessory protein